MKIYRSSTKWGHQPYLESIRVAGEYEKLPEVIIIDYFPYVFFKKSENDAMDFFGTPLVQYHPQDKPKNTDPEGLNRGIYAPMRFPNYNELAESIPVAKWQRLRNKVWIAEITLPLDGKVHEI